MLLLSLLSFFIFFIIFFTLSLFLTYRNLKISISNNKNNNNKKRTQQIQTDPSVLKRPLLNSDDRGRGNDPTRLTESLLLEILPSKSAKWESLFGEGGRYCEDPDKDGSGHEKESDGGDDDNKRVSNNNKRKKKRAKKKRLDSKGEEENGSGGGGGDEDDKCTERGSESSDSGQVKPELVCLYPFTSTSSATQRKIKQQYDQLVKCHENKGLTLAQVGEFANCLIEARHELQHKSEAIKRKFTITKALLFKADRSSFDRLRQQIYKLEMEQKRLEEDAFVYNWLQQQLKLSPAYKKMLEISAGMELKEKSSAELTEESTDSDEFAYISFEELLAQEKKDSFWQKNGRSRLSSS